MNRKSKVKSQKSNIQFKSQKWITSSSGETKKRGAELAEKILRAMPSRRAIVIGLKGELGSGKTTFVQGFAKGLGIKAKILSPTFIIMKKFKIPAFAPPSLKLRRAGKASAYAKALADRSAGKRNSQFKNFYHIDCYRLEHPRELLRLGWKEIVSNSHNIVLVEWADRVQSILPGDPLRITFHHKDEKHRIVTIYIKKFNAT